MWYCKLFGTHIRYMIYLSKKLSGVLNFTSEFKTPVSRGEVRWVDVKGHRHLCDHKKYLSSILTKKQEMLF